MALMYFLNINKEKGISSFDVIRKLRKVLNVKKIGHSGTLDPLAQGVLQIAVGDATRLLEFLDSDKEYIAELKFGYISSTQDDEGKKTFISAPSFDKKELSTVLKSFTGKILQIPPKYSAIKINGKKLCDLARKNKEIPEIKPRLIEIYEINLINFIPPDYAKINIKCSKGTYIRTLAQDIGEKLGCGAFVSNLTRTRAGNFSIFNSVEISPELENFAINPVDVLNLNKVKINEEEYKKILNGNSINYSELKTNSKKYMLIYNNKLVSIANLSDNILKVEKVFKTE